MYSSYNYLSPFSLIPDHLRPLTCYVGKVKTGKFALSWAKQDLRVNMVNGSTQYFNGNKARKRAAKLGITIELGYASNWVIVQPSKQ